MCPKRAQKAKFSQNGAESSSAARLARELLGAARLGSAQGVPPPAFAARAVQALHVAIPAGANKTKRTPPIKAGFFFFVRLDIDADSVIAIPERVPCGLINAEHVYRHRLQCIGAII